MPTLIPQWLEWVGMLNSLPRIERLGLECQYSPSPFDSMPLIHLPVLHTLDLRNLSRLEVITSFVVPNINTLVLFDVQAEKSD